MGKIKLQVMKLDQPIVFNFRTNISSGEVLKQLSSMLIRNEIMVVEVWIGYNSETNLFSSFNSSFLENMRRMQKLMRCMIKLKLVCGIGLVKLRCWTLNQVPFLGICSLHFTTLSILVAMNIPRMK
ncbi:hypothetical protein P8452_70912 [Trifolium repens]|nr:hypothetical protein P8452_70912 [Trifolium repens]